jgi:hypothetical protein
MQQHKKIQQQTMKQISFCNNESKRLKREREERERERQREVKNKSLGGELVKKKNLVEF